MDTGTIKTLTEKGFGFISREGHDKDLFFHMNECADFDSLKEGQTVEFTVEDGPKGPSATGVTVVEAAA